MNIQDRFPLELTDLISFPSKGLSSVFSSTTVRKHHFFVSQPSLWSNSHICTMTLGKTIALPRWTFIGKVMSPLFNMLSRFIIAFLPRSKCLLISWLQSPSAVILEPKKIKSVSVSTFSPFICPEVMGLDAMIFIFWMLNFKPAFSLSSFTSSRGSSAPVCFLPLEWYHLLYLRLLLFLPAILIPAWDSSSPAFLMMYSACKLNKQRGNIQPWWTPSPFLN